MAQQEMSRTCLHAQIRSVFHRTSRAQIGFRNSTIVAFKSRFYIGRHQVLPSSAVNRQAAFRLNDNGPRSRTVPASFANRETFDW
jgi:hypothetical protein